jgi:hypothetical protein
MECIKVFDIAYRNQVRDYVLKQADSDDRIVAGAVIGSLALEDGDRWSDLDLTFAVSDGTPIRDVLEDWTRDLVRELDAVHLFDVRSGETIYRVFLMPGCLQFDLSFTPASNFGAAGPKFRLLFGKAVEKPFATPPSAKEIFGYAVHHVLRARVCIERGRYWQAEYWISAARDYALSLACLRRGLPSSYGRGMDDLPSKVREDFRGALVPALERDDLMRALSCSIEGLLQEAEDVRELADKVEPDLRKLSAEWET